MSGIGFGPVLYASNCVTDKNKIRFGWSLLLIGSLFSLLATGLLTVYIGNNSF
jgi:hypothetical protein